MYPEYIEAEEDFYNAEVLSSKREDDELSMEEEGFMLGYLACQPNLPHPKGCSLSFSLNF